MQSNPPTPRDFTTEPVHGCVLLLYLQKHVLSPFPLPSLMWYLQMGENGECKRLFFRCLSGGGKGRTHDLAEVLLADPSLGAFIALRETCRRFCRWDPRTPSRGARRCPLQQPSVPASPPARGAFGSLQTASHQRWVRAAGLKPSPFPSSRVTSASGTFTSGSSLNGKGCAHN